MCTEVCVGKVVNEVCLCGIFSTGIVFEYARTILYHNLLLTWEGLC